MLGFLHACSPLMSGHQLRPPQICDSNPEFCHGQGGNHGINIRDVWPGSTQHRSGLGVVARSSSHKASEWRKSLFLANENVRFY